VGGDGLTFEVVANATWIMPRSGYSEERGTKGFEDSKIRRFKRLRGVQRDCFVESFALGSKAFASQGRTLTC